MSALIDVVGLTIKNPSKKNTLLLHDVSCTIAPQRITLLIGKSGAGKTTLLKSIANLYTDYTGSILFEGKDVRLFSRQERAARIGFVFQNFNLFPHMTVLANCVQPLMVVQHYTSERAEQHVVQMLQHFDMDAYVNAYPQQLSGGQQQRIAIIRAMCLGPRVLLLDEPTSALDPDNVLILTRFLQRLSAVGIAIAIASQDVLFVRSLMDRVYFLDHGEIVESFDATAQQAPEKESNIGRFIAQ